MSSQYERRLGELSNKQQSQQLSAIQRGIEKESLRITTDGRLAQTPHPAAMGSALCHPYITTDYSEALLEFITPVSTDLTASLTMLDDIHRYTYGKIGEELLWSASMPCILEGDDQIPVAQYGSSNVARMKTVYRYGLGHRYGRLMQTIAGIHYNFSLPAEYWPLAQAADGETGDLQDYITKRYLDLIRNFRRHSWLLIYLFGASPAVCSSFLRGNTQHQLVPFDEGSKSLHAPYGTALRMGDLGYSSNAQKDLQVCYNDLDLYIDTLSHAITQSHPEYEEIGIGEEGHERQLNTSLLQIENEFYSTIRPKRVAASGETPLGALRRAGIEYVEVRCVDINPFQAVGIDREQIRFLDTFLLYCLLADSPACDDAEQDMQAENLARVVNRGREPGLTLQSTEGEVPLQELASQLLADMLPIAGIMDQELGGSECSDSHSVQMSKINDATLTPSAQILQQMKEQDLPFFRLAMTASTQWAKDFRERPLPPERQQEFDEKSVTSLALQTRLEAGDQLDFETYLQQFYAQYGAL